MGFGVNDFINEKINGMRTFLQFGIVPTLVEEAKQRAYWKDRTTNARNGLTGGVEGGGTEYLLYLAHGVEYGEWLENGTGIYGPTHKPIVPVNKKVLSWIDESGTRHYAKKVKGIKPMPILKDTLERNKDLIVDEIIKYWSD